MAYPPSMVHKSGDHLVVRSVVSGNKLFGTSEYEDDDDEMDVSGNVEAVLDESQPEIGAPAPVDMYPTEQKVELPQCKVKRNYACSSCDYYTQNPRYYLHHLKNVHHEKIRIYECPSCLYASKHSQKLQRHIHMVHVMNKRKLLIKTKTSAAPKPILPSAVRKETFDEGHSIFHQSEEPIVDAAAAMEARGSPSYTAGNALQLSADVEVEEEDSVGADESQSQLFKCSECPFSSHSEKLVTHHERSVHLKKKQYNCTKCDYTTPMKARFTKHVKYHSMPMIKCEMCDFRTPYKWNLDRHNKNHCANGAFKCSQCNFTADIKQSLTVHEMNHHVPPISQNGASGQVMQPPVKRRCRVGASDIIDQQEATAAESDFDDLDLLRMERESLPSAHADECDDNDNEDVDEAAEMAAVDVNMVKPNASTGGKALNLKNPTAAAFLNGAIKPEDVIMTKNGSVYMKKYQCRVCKYKAAWESEMVRHELRVHGLDSAYGKKKPLPRPIPNLIPLQNNANNGGSGSACSSTAVSPSHSTASTPTGPKSSVLKASLSSPLRNGGGILSGGLTLADLEYDKPLTEKDLNEIYSRSCATSSLKDFASLIGADESTLKSDKFVLPGEETVQPKMEPEEGEEKVLPKTELDESVDVKPAENDTQAMDGKKLPDAFKKKSASFFEKNATFFNHLKEKLMVGGGEIPNLSCWCGHQSKCLSESVLHHKTHSENPSEKNDSSIRNGPLISGADLSSTRCQYCRQRCKTSSDLFAHLQSCPELNKKETLFNKYATDSHQVGDADSRSTTNDADDMPMDEDAPDHVSHEFEDFSETGRDTEPPSKVFVWNKFLEKDDGEDQAEDECRSKSPASESSLVGYEIAPGIGSVMPSSNEEAAESFKEMNIDIHNVETTTKKVFKCPTCSFWASTASRFHVHVVSHMNVKPFGCSVCPYQSKWKWDVTKHIKLKKERDPAHEGAKMRTIDVETGRRNYTKYNRFLTPMRVHEPRLDLSSAALKSVVTSTPVPLLPKLTPAPSINGEADVGDSDVTMRPLPQLHPANPSMARKRPHEGGDSTEEGEPAKKNERKVWKCKKCQFRNTVRSKVLAHVKGHYAKAAMNRAAATASAADGADSMNGESHVSVNGIIRCHLCNFETDNQTTFRIHNSHHIEDPSAAFRCCFCPFFANDKQFMINHISTHGFNNAEELVMNAINNEDSYRKDDCEDKMETSADEQETGEMNDSNPNKSEPGPGDEMEVYKRFRCQFCPYVTNNKSQYLYHKQFHKPHDAPFKCTICSYNVTKRHLLHQHLKIHGVKRAQFKSCLKAAAETKSVEDDGMKLNTDVDTAHLPDVPLVWVHKAGTLTKMFKCRHCPHVNLRKSNIHEHEKMHFDRLQRSPNGSVTTGQVSTHHCNDCNYVCNNAGALASHAKVHQGAFGQICALADPRRSDESQIREITRLFKEDERFKKEAPKPQSLEKRLMPPAATVCPSARGDDGSVDAVPSDAFAPPPVDRKDAIGLKTVFFCNVCPARFFQLKDLQSHARFHGALHPFKCNSCSYTAPAYPQLEAHMRVHGHEYQVRTDRVVQKNAVSREYPRPRTVIIPDKPGSAGLGWVVMHSPKREDAVKPAKAVVKQFSCPKCPAQFFKSVALQHHLTLHGGKDQFECRACDYRVKTYGNLIKHEAVHGLEPRLKAKVLKSQQKMSFIPAPAAPVNTSGSELARQSTHKSPSSSDAPRTYVTPTPPSAAAIAAAGLAADPEFGIFIYGSPDFVYPQTQKNGKMKEKRYKCHKCPSAFEKREQYKTHLTLHGAKSKFRCDRCDYAVKYVANYAQHVRKHEICDHRVSERRANLLAKSGRDDTNSELSGFERTNASFGLGTTGDDSTAELLHNLRTSTPENIVISQQYTTPTKATKTLHISVADQQAVVLMQEKMSDCGINMADQLHRCVYCPYSHQRKDAVENHERCHINPKGSCVCEFCNYTVPQPHFLREHQKLHFGAMKGVKPEAYMKCDRLEIWMETEEGKVLIFKDSGRKDNRFEPPVTVNEEDSEFKKMYVDVKTGEECTPHKNESQFEEGGNDCRPISSESSYSFGGMQAAPLLVKLPSSSSSSSRAYELAKINEEMAEVKEEPMDDDESKVDDMDEEDYLNMVENPDDEELENSGEDDDDEEEEDDDDDVECIEKDEEDESFAEEHANVEPTATEEIECDQNSEDLGETDDEAEFENAERSSDCLENDISENMDESIELKVDAPDLEDDEEKELVAINRTIDSMGTNIPEKPEDSDSEDSESSSSSSSGTGSGTGTGSRSGSGSVSGSSCSSSDSSDDEENRDNSAETTNTTNDSTEADVNPPE